MKEKVTTFLAKLVVTIYSLIVIFYNMAVCYQMYLLINPVKSDTNRIMFFVLFSYLSMSFSFNQAFEEVVKKVKSMVDLELKEEEAFKLFGFIGVKVFLAIIIPLGFLLLSYISRK